MFAAEISHRGGQVSLFNDVNVGLVIHQSVFEEIDQFVGGPGPVGPVVPWNGIGLRRHTGQFVCVADSPEDFFFSGRRPESHDYFPSFDEFLALLSSCACELEVASSSTCSRGFDEFFRSPGSLTFTSAASPVL